MSQITSDDVLSYVPGYAVPAALTVDAGLPLAEAAAVTRAAQAFYGFWASGAEKLLAAAIDERFTDHTLPPGRPRGPAGPATASRAFRAAAPDLTCQVEEFLVVADRVTARLHFTGTFTGVFQGITGTGTRVDFIAIDVLRVTGGKVTDNWHLEDNLTLFTQLGAVQAGHASD